MHLPILRCALLGLCLTPIPAHSAVLAARGPTDDPTRIVLDRVSGAASIPSSAFDERPLVASEGVWFHETAPGPVAEPAAPLRELVLENADEIARRHAAASLARTIRSPSEGATFLDAWILLAPPFLLPVILRRRQRRAARTGRDRPDAGRDPLDAWGAPLDAAIDAPRNGRLAWSGGRRA